MVIGVPDSLLRALPELVKNDNLVKHIVAANEGSAIAIGAGSYLATGRPSLIYMQNSGLCNAVDPLLSLVHKDIYAIPMVLIIGWRGWAQDEVQHRPTGRSTYNILVSSGVEVISGHAPIEDIQTLPSYLTKAFDRSAETSGPTAVLVGSGVLDQANQSGKPNPKTPYSPSPPSDQTTKADIINGVLSVLPNDAIIVSSLGYISREVEAARLRGVGNTQRDFLVLGSMGHASSVALGLALNASSRNQAVVCLDGDGALLMHLGVLATTGSIKPQNLCHIVLNDAIYESVGGVPSAAGAIRLIDVAMACGLNAVRVIGLSDTIAAVKHALTEREASFVEVLITSRTS